MKKLVIMMAMLFAFTMNSFAEDNAANEVENAVAKYDMNINYRRLACALDLSKDQVESMENIMAQFENGMLLAAYAKNDDAKDKIVRNAVTTNTKYMHYVLNKEQYKKYLLLLNTTLNNRGILPLNED